MEILRYNKSSHNLELELNEESGVFEISLWVDAGAKLPVARWENAFTIDLVFISGFPFLETVDKDSFWDLAKEGQAILENRAKEKQISEISDIIKNTNETIEEIQKYGSSKYLEQKEKEFLKNEI